MDLLQEACIPEGLFAPQRSRCETTRQPQRAAALPLGTGAGPHSLSHRIASRPSRISRSQHLRLTVRSRTVSVTGARSLKPQEEGVTEEYRNSTKKRTSQKPSGWSVL